MCSRSVAESNGTEVCSIGKYCKKMGSCTNQLKLLTDLSDEDRELIEFRSNVALPPGSSICSSHQKFLLVFYAGNQRSCCDPLKKHKRPITQSLREISIEYCINLRQKGHQTIPGQKICTNCIKLMKDIAIDDHNSSQGVQCQGLPQLTPDSQSDKSSATCTPQESALDFCNYIFQKVGQSPIKIKGGRLNQKIKYGQDKLVKFTECVEQKLKKSLDLPTTCTLSTSADVTAKAKLFDILVTDLQDKIKESNRSLQKTLLTILPVEMTHKDVAKSFNVSERLVRQSRQLRSDEGIFAVPRQKVGKTLEKSVVDHVVNFYLDDVGEHSRIMPGMRDRVRIGKNEYAQKRLMLCNLRELYAQFKTEYPEDKVGFSKFCEMRPKQCILPGASGTHTICVCLIHQNFKLLLKACGLECSCTDFISKIVCNVESKNCMFGICEKCRRDTTFSGVLAKLLFPDDQDDEDGEAEDEYEYQEWLATDRATLVTKRAARSELIDLVESKLNLLLPHDFIAKQQSNYLKLRKRDLKAHEAIVQLDFSENYKYVVQDDIAQRYWNQEAVTIHPVVIYLNDNETVINKNMCFFTEDLKHDVSVVKLFIKKILEYVQKEFPEVKDFEFFSDGCGGQYKNSEIFAFLPECEELFSINVKWNFFATSHGKSACDGIGGMIKRQAAIASLKRPYGDQIMTPKSLLKFCHENIKSVNCQHVDPEEIMSVRNGCKKEAKTIPGTRSFHQFSVHNKQIIKCKNTSMDENWALVFDLKGKVVKSWEAKLYVAFVFNNNWHLGLIIHSNEHDLVAEISLVSYDSVSRAYFFPDSPVYLSVPFPHVLCEVKLTEKKKPAGMFLLNKAQSQKVQTYFKKFSIEPPET